MENRHLQLGHYLVAFLDVLGQRERFKALHLPKSPEEAAEVAEVLRQTAGFVLDLRRVFGRQFVGFESGLTYIKQHTNESICPKFVGFSDSFVTSVPLHNDDSDVVPIFTVFSALSAAALVMIVSLASKHPLRGGIDVGLATEISPGEIYGTALERAYLLESQEAKYPRIVIGDELWIYLNMALANFQAQATSEAGAIAATVEKLMMLITVDGDGKRILDYLGPVMSEIVTLENKEAMIRPLYEFVLAEQKRISDGGNPELIARYQALRQYVESRLPLWDVEAVKTGSVPNP
jgi:hypothetical protein